MPGKHSRHSNLSSILMQNVWRTQKLPGSRFDRRRTAMGSFSRFLLIGPSAGRNSIPPHSSSTNGGTLRPSLRPVVVPGGGAVNYGRFVVKLLYFCFKAREVQARFPAEIFFVDVGGIYGKAPAFCLQFTNGPPLC